MCRDREYRNPGLVTYTEAMFCIWAHDQLPVGKLLSMNLLYNMIPPVGVCKS
jgi:hypothetical protein